MKLLKLLKEEKNNVISFIMTPIIGILLVSFVYSKVFVENIPFGVVDLDNSSLSRSIVQQLKNHPGLKVNYYTDSQAELENAIKKKQVNGGIIIPEDFSKNLSLKKAPNALILVDGTNMIIGGNALGYSSAVLGTLSAGIQLNVLQGNNLLPYIAKSTLGTFSYVERTLYDPQSSYIRNLAYTVVPFSIQMVFLTQFIMPLLIEKKKVFSSIKLRSKEGIENIFNILGRILLISIVSIISSFTALGIIGKMYRLPLRGDIVIYIVLMSLFFINLTAVGLVFSSFINNNVYFFQFYLMSNLVMIMTCGVTYPEYMMPGRFSQVVRALWPFIHVAIPLKYLNLKGVGWEVILPYINSGLKYTLFWLPIGLVLYSVSVIRNKKGKLIDINENDNDVDNEVNIAV